MAQARTIEPNNTFMATSPGRIMRRSLIRNGGAIVVLKAEKTYYRKLFCFYCSRGTMICIRQLIENFAVCYSFK